MGPMFESGDQDYDSAAGWAPGRQWATVEAADRERNPRKYSSPPEMLYIREARYFMENAAETAPITQLFGPFWLLGEVAIMFAPTGVGKSVLATQIAESLCRGVPFAPFENPAGPETGPQRVLYLDFEQTREQFTRRYSCATTDGCGIESTYQLSPDLLRSELYWDGNIIDGYKDYTDMLFEDLRNRLDEHQSSILIVDNITFLSRSSMANASIAFSLMDRLQSLKKDRFISILVLAHTTKRRRDGPLIDADMQGSVDLAKIADSAFAIGRSRQSPDLRYLKHIKSRSCRIEHGAENVAVFKLEKFDFASVVQPGGECVDNFLGFEFETFDHEDNHVALRETIRVSLRRRPQNNDYMIKRAKSLASQGLSSAAIAAKLGVGKSTAHRYLTVA